MREFHWAGVILTASSDLVSQYSCLAITLKSPYKRHQMNKVLYLLHKNAITALASFIYTQFFVNNLPSIHTILHITNELQCQSYL
jgi:Na+/proline symporter